MRLSMEEKQALYDYACPKHRDKVKVGHCPDG